MHAVRRTLLATVGAGLLSLSVAGSAQALGVPMTLAPGTTYQYRVITEAAKPGFDVLMARPPLVAGPVQTFTTPSSPIVATDGAHATGPTTATIEGNADPQGQETMLHADYALAGEPWCTSGGAEGTPLESMPQSLGSGNVMISEIGVPLAELTAASEYCAALVASNAGGTSQGRQVTFTTPAERPTVTAISPNSGEASGGTTITITGTNLSNATAVRFGTNEAASFHVESETSIKALSPGGVGTVDVTVAGPFGSGTSPTSPADRYTYEGLPAPPSVETTPKPLVLLTPGTLSVSLGALVNPHGAEVGSCVFEYGPTASYGQSTPCSASPGSGDEPVRVGVSLSTVKPQHDLPLSRSRRERRR